MYTCIYTRTRSFIRAVSWLASRSRALISALGTRQRERERERGARASEDEAQCSATQRSAARRALILGDLFPRLIDTVSRFDVPESVRNQLYIFLI